MQQPEHANPGIGFIRVQLMDKSASGIIEYDKTAASAAGNIIRLDGENNESSESAGRSGFPGIKTYYAPAAANTAGQREKIHG